MRKFNFHCVLSSLKTIDQEHNFSIRRLWCELPHFHSNRLQHEAEPCSQTGRWKVLSALVRKCGWVMGCKANTWANTLLSGLSEVSSSHGQGVKTVGIETRKLLFSSSSSPLSFEFYARISSSCRTLVGSKQRACELIAVLVKRFPHRRAPMI